MYFPGWSQGQEALPKELAGRGVGSPDSQSETTFKILYFGFSIWFCLLETFIKMQMFLGKSNQLPSTTKILLKNWGKKYDFLQEQGSCVHKCTCLLPSLLVGAHPHASVCGGEPSCVSLCGHVSVWVCVCMCVVYVHVLSSRGLGVQIVGFLIWSKLHEFSGLGFLICKSRSDRMSSRSLHAQMLYDPVKLWNGRWEVQIPAPLFTVSPAVSLSWRI